MMEPNYVYRAKLNRVIDGDSYILDLDLGFHVWRTVRVRLRGYNAPELNEPGGEDQKQRAFQLLFAGPILVQSYRDQRSFDRWIADVWVDGRPLAEMLAE